MKKITALWDWLAERHWFIRLLLKLFIFAFVFIAVVFPNPVFNIKQISAYLDTEALFTSFPELDDINAQIDSLLPDDYTFKQEYNTIVRFVYEKIPYQFDWDNWSNAEYWPSAQETWERGREDCDGRAILAVAIFRSRGYADANVVGSMKHLWIKVSGQEGMGPDTEKIMVVEDGKKKMRLPSFMYMLDAVALQLYYYPIFRMVLLLLTLLFLIFHPAKNTKLFLALALCSILGFIMLIDWAHYVSFYEEMKINANFVFGFLLLVVTIFSAFFSNSVLRKRNSR